MCVIGRGFAEALMEFNDKVPATIVPQVTREY